MFEQQAVTTGIRALEGAVISMVHGQFELEDLRGQRFGLLEVTARAPNNRFGLVYWYCRCTCGEVVSRRANVLRAGKFYTCGKAACRFFEKVDLDGPVMPGMTTPCHVWTGALHSGGYGVFKQPGTKKLLRAHVFAFEQKNGPVPTGMMVLHQCDNRPCVRDDHLFAGTHVINMADMAAKGRNKTARKHLSDAQRVDLRADAADGRTYEELSAKYGTTIRTVGRTIRGR